MQKISLLVADDEDVFRKGIIRYIRLHSERFDPILPAVDGEETEELILQKNPDLLLLDIQMPKKSGIEVLNDVQNTSVKPATIILSGYDEFKYAQQAIRLGAKDYILKPVLSSEIFKKLNQIADECFGLDEGEATGQETDANNFAVMARYYMEEHYFEEVDLEEVADKVGISPGYLSTLFMKTYGYGFVECLNRIRVEHARPYLQQNLLKTYEIAYKVGYHDEKYFSKVFRKITGFTPSEYRKQKSGD